MLAEMCHLRVPTLMVARLAHELRTVLFVQMLTCKFLRQLRTVLLPERNTTAFMLQLELTVQLLQMMKLNRADRIRLELRLSVERHELAFLAYKVWRRGGRLRLRREAWDVLARRRGGGGVIV